MYVQLFFTVTKLWPRRGGDFHRAPRETGRGAHLVPPNPGGGWQNTVPQQTPHQGGQIRKRKIRGRRGGRQVQKGKTPVGAGIYNLSGKPFNDDEIRVLDRGLKYAPTRNLNKFHTYINLQKYIQNVSIKNFFLSNPVTRTATIPEKATLSHHSNLRNKSVFNPANADTKHLDVFRNIVMKGLELLKVRAKDSSSIKKGIDSLMNRKDSVIRPADKGGDLVVLSKVYYKNEMENLLSDTNTYIIIAKDPIL